VLAIREQYSDADLLRQCLIRGGDFVPGFVIAAVLPCLIAIYKFSVAATMIDGTNKMERTSGRSVGAAICRAVFSIVGFCR